MSIEISNKNRSRIKDVNDLRKSFGFKQIDALQKQSLINDVFHSVAKRYDIMNDVMSAGLHHLWKDAMVAWLSPPQGNAWKVLDVAGGTGDIAFRILETSCRRAHVTVLDINTSMLKIGHGRAVKKNLTHCMDFIEANAEFLPFANNHFDAFTIAFGIRNIPNINKVLEEALRVLKPGGHFICLEFSEVKIPFFDKLYDLWSFHAIPRIGQIIAGDASSYRYLVESIRKFPQQKDFAAMIRKIGFSRVNYRNLIGGIAAIHSGWKI
ncbi:MAG: 4-benzoquinol methylase [Candidatus Tokpelaia sp. JSC188]|nr:MAG: 4-benzoquinol methylase [Candidatus Tokpelaia sp. JSC188]